MPTCAKPKWGGIELMGSNYGILRKGVIDQRHDNCLRRNFYIAVQLAVNLALGQIDQLARWDWVFPFFHFPIQAMELLAFVFVPF